MMSRLRRNAVHGAQSRETCSELTSLKHIRVHACKYHSCAACCAADPECHNTLILTGRYLCHDVPLAQKRSAWSAITGNVF